MVAGAWFGGMWIVSALSGHDLGGYGVLGFWTAVVVTTVWSLVVVELPSARHFPPRKRAES